MKTERTNVPSPEFEYVGGRYWVDTDGRPWYKTKKIPVTYVLVDDPNENTDAIQRVRIAYVTRVLDKLVADVHAGIQFSGSERARDKIMELIYEVGRYDRIGKLSARPAIVRPKRES